MHGRSKKYNNVSEQLRDHGGNDNAKQNCSEMLRRYNVYEFGSNAKENGTASFLLCAD